MDADPHVHIDPRHLADQAAEIRLRIRKSKRRIEEGILWKSEMIETHKCSSEELGFSGSNHKFWPVNTNYERFVEPYQNIFECVDPSNLAVQGNDGTISGQAIFIDLVKCDKGQDV